MVLVVALVLYCWFGVVAMTVSGGGGNVTYDNRSLIINGKHTLLFSGSIHYPRSTPQMWPSLIAKAKAGGLDVIQTYVFWGLHEPHSGTFDFTGGNDLVKFIKEIQAQGLYACLRIGPFIEAEVSYGGLPFWLHDVPGIVFRTDNEPFKYYMERFVTKVVTMMKSEGLYASQGGPIVLSQIENEYGKMEKLFRKSGQKYLHWAANMAVGLDTGVPWVMCKQDDAPDPLINACNGRRCGETFKGPNSPNKPAIWTENWTSFYQNYGRCEEIRSAQDIAFHVSLFIARKGSYVNYYMYHGGTNFGRVASSYMVTSYYDQAPLDEYGMLRQPKWGHLRELHAAIKLGLKPILSGEQFTIPLGKLQQGYVFKSASGECVAFLVNNDDRRKNAIVNFQNSSYDLPPKSISILPDCKSVVFNSAKVTAQYSTRSMESSQKLDSSEKWQEYAEDIPNFDATSIRASTLLEHTNVTKDGSDYLWYTFSFQRDSPDAQSFLSVKSKGHVVHAFVNGVFVGSAHGHLRSKMPPFKSSVQLNAGMNYVSLLSVMVGLPDSGPYLESRYAGLYSVKIENNDGSQDFSNYPWGYQVGLYGERAKIYAYEGSGKINWNSMGSSTLKPLTWYKTSFDAPAGNDPIALNLGSMGKGETWVNGHSIGRYWESFRTSNGTPSQTWYNVPRSFLKPNGNLLVLLEEEWGNPLEISVAIVTTSKVCGHVHDSYPPPVNTWRGLSHHGRRPKVQLRCPYGRTISKVLFASFGTPWGDCGSYGVGGCHSSHSTDVVEKACIGKSLCTVPVSAAKFEDEPCAGVPKALLVEAQCS